MITTRAEILIALGKGTSIADADLAMLDVVHPLAEAALMAFLQSDLNYQRHVEYYPLGRATKPRRTGTLDEYDAELSAGGDQVVLVDRREGSDSLQLRNLPVWEAGLEVREDEGGYAGQGGGDSGHPFADATILTAGNDFYLDVDDAANGISNTGLLRRITGQWSREPRSVRVSYYGGLSHSQLASVRGGEVKLAAIKTVVHNYWSLKNSQTGSGPKISETIGKYSYMTDSSMLAAMGGPGVAVPPQVKNDLFHRVNVGNMFRGGF